MSSEPIRDPVTDHLLTPHKTVLIVCAYPALDALREGYEVYVVVDAVGGTSATAHEMALRRVEQAGGKMISVTQLFCELQRDWRRKETVPGFMTLFFDMGGSAGVAAAED